MSHLDCTHCTHCTLVHTGVQWIIPQLVTRRGPESTVRRVVNIVGTWNIFWHSSNIFFKCCWNDILLWSNIFVKWDLWCQNKFFKRYKNRKIHFNIFLHQSEHLCSIFHLCRYLVFLWVWDKKQFMAGLRDESCWTMTDFICFLPSPRLAHQNLIYIWKQQDFIAKHFQDVGGARQT